MYPINLDIKGKLCVVIGGGHVAWRKVKTLLEEKARIVVVAPELRDDTLKGENAPTWDLEGTSVSWLMRKYHRGLLAEISEERLPVLVFAATDKAEVNREIAEEANELGILVNCVTDKELCDFQVPSRVQRGDLIFTVSTGGGSPAFSRLLRKDLEKQYNDNFGKWLAVQEKLREKLKATVEDTKVREKFWRKLMEENGDELLQLIRESKIKQAEQLVERCMK